MALVPEVDDESESEDSKKESSIWLKRGWLGARVGVAVVGEDAGSSVLS
jgi:hypothetical protein